MTSANRFHYEPMVIVNEPVCWTHDPMGLIEETVDRYKLEGIQFYRVTLVNDRHKPVDLEDATGIWIEGWDTTPDDPGPFAPPVAKVMN